MSVIRRCRRCRKIFTFPSSSLEPLYQFQPYLAQSILGRRRGFKFVQMNSPVLFQVENSENTLMKFKNLLHQNHWANFNQTWQHKFLDEGDIFKLVQMKIPALFQMENNFELAKLC